MNEGSSYHTIATTKSLNIINGDANGQIFSVVIGGIRQVRFGVFGGIRPCLVSGGGTRLGELLSFDGVSRSLLVNNLTFSTSDSRVNGIRVNGMKYCIFKRSAVRSRPGHRLATSTSIQPRRSGA